MANFPIFGGYDKRQNVVFNSEDLVNLFMVTDYKGKKQNAFIATPGLNHELTVRSGGLTRALFPLNGFLYSVCGNTISKINNAFVDTNIGTIGTMTGYVSISSNDNNQIIFVDGQSGYIYDQNSGVFSQISSVNFPPKPINVAYLDGYFIIPSAESTMFQVSALNDGTQWSALDDAFIRDYPGNNMGVAACGRRLFFFKTQSTAVWYDAGQADFPLRPDRNLLFNFGCASTSSITTGFGLLIWLASDQDGIGSFMMATKDSPVPESISTSSIDDLIASFEAPKDVVCYLYKDMDHIFLVATWNTDDVTLTYDFTSKQWQRMEMEPSISIIGDPNSGKTRHLSNCHAFFNNKHIVGSYKDSQLYNFSRDFYTNDGETIRRMRVTPHFFDQNYKRIQTSSIEFDMETGVGLEKTDYSSIYHYSSDDPWLNPKAYLSLSRDNGRTFGNRHEAAIGKIGEFKQRVIFHKLGVSRDLVAKFEIFAPVPVAIVGASIEYKGLAA